MNMNGPYTRPGFDAGIFNAARDGSYQDIRHFDVDLTTARTFAAGTYLDVPVSADSIYIDANPTDGNAVLYLQPRGDNKVEVPLYVSPGFILNDQPFTRIRIENTAQAGKKIRVVYGVGARFQPGSVAQVQVNALDLSTTSINSLTRPLQPTGFWSSTADGAANTPLTIFTAASNTNGAIIVSAKAKELISSSYQGGVFILKASAPANIADGSVIASDQIQAMNGSSEYTVCELRNPIRVAAGLGLYYISTAGSVASRANRHCTYILL